jgi:hypothetical protein
VPRIPICWERDRRPAHENKKLAAGLGHIHVYDPPHGDRGVSVRL